MVDSIGKGSGLAREAIRAALRSQSASTTGAATSPATSGLAGAADISRTVGQAFESALAAGASEGVRPSASQDPFAISRSARVDTSPGELVDALKQGLKEVDREVRRAEDLPRDMAVGKVTDFHEVSMQLRKADLSFRFALEIRNKLIDAYREVMRMQV